MKWICLIVFIVGTFGILFIIGASMINEQMEKKGDHHEERPDVKQDEIERRGSDP